MKKARFAWVLAVLIFLMMMPAATADIDTGMEGLWTGTDAEGRYTLLLGSGGTFISIYRTDRTYRQAGVFTVDIDNMYLTMTDGSASTMQYGFAEGSLFLSSDGEEVELKRADFAPPENLSGVWTVESSGGGLIAMDAAGGFASIDVETGKSEKGIYLPDQGDLIIAFQDCTSMQVGYVYDAETGVITLTNPESNQTMTLRRYAQAAGE